MIARNQSSRGFTLIEILVAATIIAVLSVIGVVSYVSINKRSRDAKRKSDLEQTRSALELYRTDNGSYPGSSVGFTALSLLDDGSGTGPLVPTYLPEIPVDPKNTADVSVQYWYSPLGSGNGPFYNYCLCAALETEIGAGTCGSSVTLPEECTYGLKNP
jgi:general secretion pathway protein G